ncbi:MAG: undecaprenyl-diphosphate phosphatase [Alphaproteobacteria bacterium]|nr:undecaprenyl-diphosphate phosphatase [Alphaproteobacteria bacterium]
MDWMNAVIMGLVEGLTEFLPVSSTGHLLLMDEILGFKGPSGNVFEIVIQFGAILAVVAVYFQRLWQIAVKAPTDPAARRFIWAVLLAFLPSMLIGYVAHGFIKAVLFNPWVVAVSLIVGGFAILWIEKKAPQPDTYEIEAMSFKTALYIGLAQCLAMIPGVSRSGATIMGSLLLKVERKVAAEFSFFLAIPTMAAATAYDLYKNFGSLTANDGLTIAIGFVVAFFSALVVVKTFVAFIGKHGFAPFAWYRIAVGVLALVGLGVAGSFSV